MESKWKGFMNKCISFQLWPSRVELFLWLCSQLLALWGGLLDSNILCHVFDSLKKPISTPVITHGQDTCLGVCSLPFRRHLVSGNATGSVLPSVSPAASLINHTQRIQAIDRPTFIIFLYFHVLSSPLMFPGNLVTDNKLTDLRTEYYWNAKCQPTGFDPLLVPPFFPSKQTRTIEQDCSEVLTMAVKKIKFNTDRCKVIKTRKDQDPACIHNDGLWIGY